MPECAEIEAVARALLPEGVGSWDEQSDLQRSYLLRQAEIATRTLDRVRDARGDDEVQKAWDEGRHPFGPGTGQAVTQTRYEAARSPQDEDHKKCGHGACVRPKGHTGSHSVHLEGTPFSVPQSSPYPWLTIYPDGHMECDMIGTTAVESDRRLVIMQELQAGRLKIAGGLGQ